MNNTISLVEPGEYKLRLVINKDNQKTDKYLITKINVTSGRKHSSEETICRYNDSILGLELLNNEPIYSGDLSSVVLSKESSSNIVYRAKDIVIKNSISYFLIVFLATSLLLIFFIKKI